MSIPFPSTLFSGRVLHCCVLVVPVSNFYLEVQHFSSCLLDPAAISFNTFGPLLAANDTSSIRTRPTASKMSDVEKRQETLCCC